MCPHCHDAVRGCIHCRDAQIERRRSETGRRHRLTDDQRRAFGLVSGRLFTPAQNGNAPRSARPATHNRDPRSRCFANAVLPASFQIQ